MRSGISRSWTSFIGNSMPPSCLGHSSIVVTSDVYGHLFPRTDHGGEMAEAEKLLLA